jgi:RHH-type proline utilization regulon transcriptional repressor/proline dehydrogenase/delta 1-pyrroline-5-carboxylate dehydrogenase
VRLAEGGSMGDLVRLIVAATRAGSALFVSSYIPLPQPLVELFGEFGSPTLIQSALVETDARWHARLVAGELKTTRIRLVGGNPAALAGILKGNPDVAIYAGPVTTAGRVELLPFLHEQAVSVTAHRFGNPDHAMATLPL